jgi:hypothetical protein
MNNMTLNKLLTELNACEEAKEWAENKTWQQIFDTCHRGDWLLWLFKKVNPEDLRQLTLAKGHCANTVRHLMKDERSKKAVDVAISFGEGIATILELRDAADVAAAAYAAAAAYDAAAAYAVYAATAAYAAYAYDAAAYASAAAYAAAYAAASDAHVAREQNQLLTADICRKYLPIEIWNIKFD